MAEVLECASCKSENPQGNKFCGNCGEKLPLGCSSCGHPLPSGSKFCGQCGTPAEQSSAATTDAEKTNEPALPADTRSVSQSGEQEAERRQLTVMFCDLANSTALSEKLDPEDLREVITIYQNACTEQIKRYDGYIARFMGDGILIYFGYPIASEDAAERAVHAGLEIINAIKKIKLDQSIDQDFDLEVRLGIATGLVVAGDIIGEGAAEEHAVLGMTPNLAARLQSIAAPNSLVISANTRELTGGFFEYTDLGKHDLKGITEPEQAWQVDGAKVTASRFEAASEKGVTPLVGRDEEISLLLNRWQRAIDGEGQVAILFGEAGVGKSRIVDGFLNRIKAEGQVDRNAIFLSCSPFHSNSAFYPLIQCLRRVMGIEVEDKVSERAAKMETFLSALLLDLEEFCPKLGAILFETDENPYPALAGTADQIKHQIFTAIASLLNAQCALRPTSFIVEDAHWIDPSTLEFLDTLIDQLRQTRVLLVIAARPSFASEWGGQPHVTTLMLNRLSRSDSITMVTNVTGGKAFPEEVIAQIIERTDGIPLFVEELTKTILESELLVEHDDHYTLAGTLSDLAIPSSLQDSLMARLDKLAPVKEVAQLAAVIGRNFDEQLLASVSPLNEAELSRSLDELVASELIFKSGAPPKISYEFKHALVQNAAYTSLLKSTRHRHHLNIAETLERDFQDVVETEPEIIAHHFTEAEDHSQAANYWQKAGQRASTRWAHQEAIGHFELGLKAIGKLPESDERASRELEFLIDKVAGQRFLERYDAAFKTLDQAEKIAAQYEHFGDLSLIHYYRGSIYFPLGNINGCLEQHELARQNAQKADSPEKEANALSGLGDAYYLQGHFRSANEQFGRCVSLCRENGITQNVSTNLAMFGHTKLYLLQMEEGLEATLEAANIAVERKNLRGEMIARGSCAAKFFYDMGDYKEAQSQCEHALGIAQKLSAHRFEPINQVILAKVLALHGDFEGALKMATEAVATSRETAFRYTGPMALGALCTVLDDPDKIYAAFSEAEETLKEECVGHNYIWFYRDAIEVCLRLQDWEKMEEYAQAAEEYTREEPLPWMEIIVARGRALSELYQNPRDPSSIEKVKKVKADILDRKFLSLMPRIEEALSSQ
ncbi:MAG: AAA family ATPase [Rhodospirillaceae bacterium]|nr:AAA family ATPase [Rhodospirillaceae bacterium]